MNNKELDLETEWEQLVNHPHASGDSPAINEDLSSTQAATIYYS